MRRYIGICFQDMNGTFQVRVEIKGQLSKNLIFCMKARLPIGIILGFLGYRHQVMPIMQSLSHTTRAYIFNAQGLPGFVLKANIIKILKEFDRQG